MQDEIWRHEHTKVITVTFLRHREGNVVRPEPTNPPPETGPCVGRLRAARGLAARCDAVLFAGRGRGRGIVELVVLARLDLVQLQYLVFGRRARSGLAHHGRAGRFGASGLWQVGHRVARGTCDVAIEVELVPGRCGVGGWLLVWWVGDGEPRIGAGRG